MQTKIINKFEHSLVSVGKGAYGQVYQAGDDMVAKVYQYNTELEYSTIREISCLVMLSTYYHIPTLYGVTVANQDKILLERAELGSLDQYFKSFGAKKMDTTNIMKLIRQMLLTLDLLNQHQIAHRDIKPANILINSSGDFLLCDFTLAKYADPDARDMLHTGVVQSLAYRAPEVILHPGKYDLQLIDVWSLGIIAIDLLCGFHIFSSTETEAGHINSISQKFGTPPLSGTIYDGKIISCDGLEINQIVSKHIEPKLCSLLQDLTEVNYLKRLRPNDLLKKHFSINPVEILPCIDVLKEYQLKTSILKICKKRKVQIENMVDYYDSIEIYHNPDTLFLGLLIFDLVISRDPSLSTRSCLGICSLSLASKVHEYEILSLEDLTVEINQDYESALEMEKKIFSLLSMMLFLPGYNHFKKGSQSDLVSDILDLSYLNVLRSNSTYNVL